MIERTKRFFFRFLPSFLPFPLMASLDFCGIGCNPHAMCTAWGKTIAAYGAHHMVALFDPLVREFYFSSIKPQGTSKFSLFSFNLMGMWQNEHAKGVQYLLHGHIGAVNCVKILSDEGFLLYFIQFFLFFSSFFLDIWNFSLQKP